MKRFILLLAIIFMSVTNSNAQLEVIDKIAGTLLPEITKGVKEILDSGGSKKKLKEEMKDLQKDLISNSQNVISAIEKDSKDLAALNALFKITGGLFEDSASMKLMTNTDFLNAIKETNSSDLYTETAINFAKHWTQLEDKKKRLSSVSATAGDNAVTDDISQYIDILDRNLINLQSVVKLTKNPQADMNYETGKTYIENLSRARDYVVDINGAIRSINVQLSSRIGTLERSLKSGKDKFEKTLQDLKSDE